MGDTNNAVGCISSSIKGQSVYFKSKEDQDSFNEEYKLLVVKYNKKYHE